MENTVVKETKNQYDMFVVGTGKETKTFFLEFFFGRRDYSKIQAADVWECIWKFAEWSGLVNPISAQYLGDDVAERFTKLVNNKEVLSEIFALVNAHSDCQLQHVFVATQII